MRAPVDLVQQEADKKRAKAAVVKTGVTQRDKMRELLAEDLAMAMPEVVCGRMPTAGVACGCMTDAVKLPALQPAVIRNVAQCSSRLLSLGSSQLMLASCKWVVKLAGMNAKAA